MWPFSPVRLHLQFCKPGYYFGPSCSMSVVDLCPICPSGIASTDGHGSETRAGMAQLWNQKAWRWEQGETLGWGERDCSRSFPWGSPALSSAVSHCCFTATHTWISGHGGGWGERKEALGICWAISCLDVCLSAFHNDRGQSWLFISTISSLTKVIMSWLNQN